MWCLFLSCSASAQNALPGIGLWREHLPYQNAVDLAASDTKIFAATPYALFSVDRTTKEIRRYSKVSGLSETGVSAIGYDASARKLFVAYANSNVDVLTEKGIVNIPGIKRSAVAGDKSINAVYSDGSRCYLSTGLGVIVLDADKYEVKDTWFIGDGGAPSKVNGFARHNGFFYAATEVGLKRTPTTTTNPADFRQWQKVSGTAGLSVAPAKAITAFANGLIALQNDSLFADSNGVWKPFFANGWPVLSVNASGDKLMVTQRQPSGASQVLALSAGGSVLRTLQQPAVISFPKKAVALGDDYWVADLYGGVSNFSSSGFARYVPDSPFDVVFGSMAAKGGTLWATAGTVNSSWNYRYNRSGFFGLKEGAWTNYNAFTHPQLDTTLDFITVAVDPRDGTPWLGSFGGGLMHLTATNTLQILKQTSPIGPTVGDPLSYRVAGLAFDKSNNLWVANFGSTRQLHVLKGDGNWQSFTAPFALFENAVAQVVIDDAGNKCIAAPLGNGLLVFNEGDLANNGDDKWRRYLPSPGLGGLPAADVLCVAKDKSGFIWVGTTNGVAVIQCTEDPFASPCDAVLPVVKEGAFAAYLFQGQEVRSIAVDGANRKWVATAGGLWLVAADGDEVLANYTETNSPLLSNDVRSLAIDGTTGEVFVATARGLVSFRGGATEYEETKGSVLVYPNPVSPDYNGSIGIRGLPENAVVKITEVSGRLVYQTRSLGGQAVWNGRDYKGREAASGVYLVLAIDEARGEKVVARIVVVR